MRNLLHTIAFISILAILPTLNASAELICGRVIVVKKIPKLSIRKTSKSKCPTGFSLIFNTSPLETKIKNQVLGGPAVDGVPAGGDLSGTYPNPTLGLATVGAANFKQLPGAKVIKSTQSTVANNFSTSMSFDTVTYDNGNYFDPTSPGRLTITIAGLYLVTGQVNYILNGTGARTATLWKNNSIFAVSSWPGNATNLTSATTTVLTRLEVGDYISLTTSQNSGADRNTVASNGGHAILQLQWMSP